MRVPDDQSRERLRRASGSGAVAERRMRAAMVAACSLLACAAAGDEALVVPPGTASGPARAAGGPGGPASTVSPTFVDPLAGAGDLVGDSELAASEDVPLDSLPAFCGDGRIAAGSEACDDGNAASGDGCTAECRQLEAGYVCPTPGVACVYDVRCGDGRVGGLESCDDGRDDGTPPVSGDGCSDVCVVEEGFVCPRLGAACRPVCGDGLVRGRERCDPAAALPGVADACDDNCQLARGWVCPAGQPCRQTVCGDGVVEGAEKCDDGNARPYDGCSPACRIEPACGSAASAAGACASACGDGILLSSDDEACDDGNGLAGDGCDADCRIEPGYACSTIVDAPPDFLDVPVVLRDFPIFQSWTGPGETNPVGHPDMNRLCCVLQTGIVQPELGVDKKPVYAGTGDDNPINQTSGQTYFDQWYRDVPGVNLRFDQSVRLFRRADGSYTLDSALDAPWAELGGFFPLEGLGYGTENLGRNFFFTSELRYWFEYQGGERLDFSGDDDVWVFVNGRLAVDLGGVHNRTSATVLLGDDGTGLGCTGDGCVPAEATDFAMQLGNIYEVVVFHAERHPGDSNYRLTLRNFLAGESRCTPSCGDGIVTPDEACDLGAAANTGEHGGCNADCSLAAFCGDGVADAAFGEQCDDGLNASLYGGCANGCVLGPGCGDGIVQPPFEQCDDGVNDGGYRECSASCQFEERCGDGIVQEDFEQCDDGENNGRGPCLPNCTLGVIQ